MIQKRNHVMLNNEIQISKGINMISGILYGLLCGWILTLFNIDSICIEVLQPLIPFTITVSHYYFVFGLVGLLYKICIIGLCSRR